MSSQNPDTADRFSQIESLINKRFDSLEQSNAQINDTLRDRKFVLCDLERENRELHQHVRTLEERLLKLERQVNNTEQNNRKNNIEVDGIPSSVPDQDLRAVVATLLNHLSESDITIGDIEVAHRLYSKTLPKPTIVRLKRNLIAEVMTKEARGKLKDIAPRMGFPRGTRIFLNDNQSPNMRSLSYNARLLKSHNLISDTWFSNAAVRIKRTPTSRAIKITHEKDLVDEFPTFQFFTFDMDFYDRLRDKDDVEQYDDLKGYSDDEDGFDRKTTKPLSASEIAAIIKSISSYNPSNGVVPGEESGATGKVTGASGGDSGASREVLYASGRMSDSDESGGSGAVDDGHNSTKTGVQAGVNGGAITNETYENGDISGVVVVDKKGEERDSVVDADADVINDAATGFTSVTVESPPPKTRVKVTPTSLPSTPLVSNSGLFGIPGNQTIDATKPRAVVISGRKSPENPHITRSTTRSLSLFK